MVMVTMSMTAMTMMMIRKKVRRNIQSDLRDEDEEGDGCGSDLLKCCSGCCCCWRWRSSDGPPGLALLVAAGGTTREDSPGEFGCVGYRRLRTLRLGCPSSFLSRTHEYEFKKNENGEREKKLDAPRCSCTSLTSSALAFRCFARRHEKRVTESINSSAISNRSCINKDPPDVRNSPKKRSGNEKQRERTYIFGVIFESRPRSTDTLDHLSQFPLTPSSCPFSSITPDDLCPTHFI
jgi:hypothetical protein